MEEEDFSPEAPAPETEFDLPENIPIPLREQAEPQNTAAVAGPGPSKPKKRPVISQQTKNSPKKKKPTIKSGEAIGIPGLLQLIAQGLLSPSYDKEIEFYWEEICKLTYEYTGETETRGAEFLAGGGLNLAVECFNRHLEQEDLILSIIVALGNLAEVDTFRRQLMTFEIVDMLIEVMRAKNYNFKTNYHAAGVLADILTETPDAWKIQIHPKVSREETLKDFRKLIVSQWNLETKDISKGFEWTSLKSFIKLLKCEHTCECQLFAAWTLANLTSVLPEEYARMLKWDQEGQVWKLLDGLRTSNDKTIVQYASIAIKETEGFLKIVTP